MSLYSEDPEFKKAVDDWVAGVKKNMPDELKKAIREFNEGLERMVADWVAEWIAEELKKKGYPKKKEK